jgi:formylglycine-generating enzyme required for sulfatase activity
VGLKLPNALGMFDMHGNAFEWCHGLDRFAESRPTDSTIKDKSRRLLRGGTHSMQASQVRSAFSFGGWAKNQFDFIGFRPSRTYNLSP